MKREIQTANDEWLVVDTCVFKDGESWVAIHREHLRYDGQRVTDPEAGITIYAHQLDALIDALQAQRPAQPSGGDKR